jgi:hypothetical protein
LTKPPPKGAGACWYWPAKLYSPIVRRLEDGTRLALRMQRLAAPAGEIRGSEGRVDQLPLVILGDCREAHDRQPMADEIVFVQPVHDEGDGARQLVVQPAVPLVSHLPRGLRQRLLGL